MLGAARDNLFDVLNPQGRNIYRRRVELLFEAAARRTGSELRRFRTGDRHVGQDDRGVSDAINDIIHDEAIEAVRRAMAMHGELIFVAGRPALVGWLRRRVIEHVNRMHLDHVRDKFRDSITRDVPGDVGPRLADRITDVELATRQHSILDVLRRYKVPIGIATAIPSAVVPVLKSRPQDR